MWFDWFTQSNLKVIIIYSKVPNKRPPSPCLFLFKKVAFLRVAVGIKMGKTFVWGKEKYSFAKK